MMAKKKPTKKKEPIKTCDDCIHEYACRIWAGGYISDDSAAICPNHTTARNSAAYLLGVLDEREGKKSNSAHIRSMSDEELAKWLDAIVANCHKDCCEGCPLEAACYGDGTLEFLKQPYKEDER